MKLIVDISVSDMGCVTAEMGRNVLAKKGVVPRGSAATEKEAVALLAAELVRLEVIKYRKSEKAGPKAKVEAPTEPVAPREGGWDQTAQEAAQA